MSKRWVLKSHILSHAAVPEEMTEAVIVNPRSGSELTLRNRMSEDMSEEPRLVSHFVFTAESLDVAVKQGEEQLSEMLGFLAFATSCRLEIERHLCVCDWTEGVTERTGYVIQTFRDPSFPFAVLGADIAASVGRLLGASRDEALDRAVRCFAQAVSVRFPVEKFRSLWFCIEVLGKRVKGKELVADKCQTCGGELRCTKCQEMSRHRPFPKQKIEGLFARYARDEDTGLHAQAVELRNLMSHGESVRSMEKSVGVGIADILDGLAHVAFSALVDALNEIVLNSDTESQTYSRTSSYAAMQVITRLTFSLPATDKPLSFDLLPGATIGLRRVAKGIETGGDGPLA